jgi:hypothetical protein
MGLTINYKLSVEQRLTVAVVRDLVSARGFTRKKSAARK